MADYRSNRISRRRFSDGDGQDSPIDSQESALATQPISEQSSSGSPGRIAPRSRRKVQTGPASSSSPSTQSVTVVVDDSGHLRDLDWGSVLASVICGMGVTLLLSVIGIATGLVSVDESTGSNEAQGILGAVGVWLVLSAVVGTFVGSFVGGRYAHWLNRGSIAYHSLTSWGLATLLTTAMLALLSIGFFNGAATAAGGAANAAATAAPEASKQAATGNQANTSGNSGEAVANNADDAAAGAADGLGTAGLALALGMVLTLGASIAGWWIGSRKPLSKLEVESDDRAIVVN